MPELFYLSVRKLFSNLPTKMANDWSAEELEAVLYAPEVEQAISEASVGRTRREIY